MRSPSSQSCRVPPCSVSRRYTSACSGDKSVLPTQCAEHRPPAKTPLPRSTGEWAEAPALCAHTAGARWALRPLAVPSGRPVKRPVRQGGLSPLRRKAALPPCVRSRAAAQAARTLLIRTLPLLTAAGNHTGGSLRFGAVPALPHPVPAPSFGPLPAQTAMQQWHRQHQRRPAVPDKAALPDTPVRSVPDTLPAPCFSRCSRTAGTKGTTLSAVKTAAACKICISHGCTSASGCCQSKRMAAHSMAAR